MGRGYSNYAHTEGAKKRLVPDELMKELENSGNKFTKSDVLMITKNYYGKLMWLEEGNERAGLRHIIKNHKSDLPSESEIPGLLKNVLYLKPIKHTERKNGNQLSDTFLYRFNKRIYLVAYGNNGFIVSFYPINNSYKGKI